MAQSKKGSSSLPSPTSPSSISSPSTLQASKIVGQGQIAPKPQLPLNQLIKKFRNKLYHKYPFLKKIDAAKGISFSGLGKAAAIDLASSIRMPLDKKKYFTVGAVPYLRYAFGTGVNHHIAYGMGYQVTVQPPKNLPFIRFDLNGINTPMDRGRQVTDRRRWYGLPTMGVGKNIRFGEHAGMQLILKSNLDRQSPLTNEPWIFEINYQF